MMEIVGDWVVRLDCPDKVGWYESCPLVNELVESMLAISTWLSPNDRSCGVVH